MLLHGKAVESSGSDTTDRSLTSACPTFCGCAALVCRLPSTHLSSSQTMFFNSVSSSLSLSGHANAHAACLPLLAHLYSSALGFPHAVCRSLHIRTPRTSDASCVLVPRASRASSRVVSKSQLSNFAAIAAFVVVLHGCVPARKQQNAEQRTNERTKERRTTNDAFKSLTHSQPLTALAANTKSTLNNANFCNTVSTLFTVLVRITSSLINTSSPPLTHSLTPHRHTSIP